MRVVGFHRPLRRVGVLTTLSHSPLRENTRQLWGDRALLRLFQATPAVIKLGWERVLDVQPGFILLTGFVDTARGNPQGT